MKDSMQPTTPTFNFEFGRVYLVKGKVDVFWFLLQDTSFRFLYEPSLNEIVEVITSPRLEPCDFVLLSRNFSSLLQLTKLNLTADEQVRVYLLLSNVDGSISKEAEKVYKNLAGGCFIQIDLNKYEWKQSEKVQSALAHLEPEIKLQLLRDIESPSVLLSLARAKNPLDYDLPEDLTVEITDLLESLGTPLSFEKWELSAFDLYRLAASETNGVGFYQVLAGGGSRVGICPELWVYLSFFLDMPLEPLYAIRLFVRWVFLASTVLQTNKHKGFLIRVVKGKTYYNFSPSKAAFELLDQLRSSFCSFRVEI